MLRRGNVLDEERLQAAVQVLIDRHGSDAHLYVAQLADECLENGDMTEHVMWTLIAKALAEIESELIDATVH